MHPSTHFFLKALFLRGPSAGFGGNRVYSAQSYIDKDSWPCSYTLPAMDFSKVGAIEHVGDAFRAHVHWRDNGQQRNTRGPRRPDEEAAKEDLESMRAAASGMSREDGFAAMKVEKSRPMS